VGRAQRGEGGADTVSKAGCSFLRALVRGWGRERMCVRLRAIGCSSAATGLPRPYAVRAGVHAQAACHLHRGAAPRVP
jgi:hypothetical protein